jgi:hypothetical protein
MGEWHHSFKGVVMGKRKQWRWEFTYVPTGDVIKGMSKHDVIARLGSTLTTDIPHADPMQYEKARDLLNDRWSINCVKSDEAVIQELLDRGLFELHKHRANKGTTTYKNKLAVKDRHGSLLVTLPNVGMKFTIPSRDFLYDMLTRNLYPTIQPTERTIRYQLLSWCTMRADSKLTTEEILSVLIERRIIQISEIVYNAG